MSDNPFSIVNRFTVGDVEIDVASASDGVPNVVMFQGDQCVQLGLDELTSLMKILEVIFREELEPEPQPMSANPEVADGKIKVNLK